MRSGHSFASPLRFLTFAACCFVFALAGKTEATKSVLQYLSTVAGSVSGVSYIGLDEQQQQQSGGGGGRASSESIDFPQMILQSNPILEAFGNSKTLRNNNSSRFGKYMEIQFEPAAGRAAATGSRKIIAARIINYLLEQSRVTVQTEGERGYHVFYRA